jgi:hypothetical protein
VLVLAIVGDPLVDGAGAFSADAGVVPEADARTERPTPPLARSGPVRAWPCELEPELGRERLPPDCGLAVSEQFRFVLCSASPRAGCCRVGELAGRQVGVALFFAGAGVGGVAVVVVVVGVVVAGVVGVARVVVGVVVAVVVGVARVVVAVVVVGVVGVVGVGMAEVVVSVGGGVCCAVVPVMVAPAAGSALAACALLAALPPAIQPFTALDMASVPATSDSRERQPARERRVRGLRCICRTLRRSPER